MIRALPVLLTLTACSGGPGAGGPGTGSTELPQYVVAALVWDADSMTTYVNVIGSLDVDAIDPALAYEFPGRAEVAVHGGKLFVSDGEAPIVHRYEVLDDGTLVEDGEVSFANHGMATSPIDEWSNTFVSDTEAWLFDHATGGYVVWDPSTLTITGEVEAPPGVVRDGLTINGSPAVARGDRLFRTFFWSDWVAYETSAEQYLAVYDTETDALIDWIPESRCPGLNHEIETDEQGNLYFSNWVYNVTETLVRGAPPSCAVRLPAGAEAFDDWTLPYAELTDGREAAGLGVLGEGQAFVAVFHDENVTIDDQTDPMELALSPNWRLWGVDLDARTAAPLEDLGLMGAGYTHAVIDDRDWLLLPNDADLTTRLFEVVDGRLEQRFEVNGWSYQIGRIR